MDQDQLISRSKETKWQFDTVREWMNDPQPGRALCILASAGTGKSTISAALCETLLGLGGSNDKSERPVIAAVHFLKFSDQRRLKPVLIIKSLAFQLAKR